MKFKNERARAQVTAFYNRYRNFINRTEIGTSTVGRRPIIQYQYQNLDHVKTYGAEASAAYKFLPGWQVSGSIAWMRGEQQDGKPLDSAYPLNGVSRQQRHCFPSAGLWRMGCRRVVQAV